MDFIHEKGRVYAGGPSGKPIAELTYSEVGPKTVDICHTFVDASLRGRGVADALMREALEDIRAAGMKTVASCPYADNWFTAHPEFSDIFDFDW